MIYLDNNATTQPTEQVWKAMITFLSVQFGNPSSAYAFSRPLRQVLETARERTADLIGARDSQEIVFTSGGTESDNWAIRGALAAAPGANHIVTTRVEHEAVRTLCENLESIGTEITWLDVDRSGNLDPEVLAAAVRPDTAVVSVMQANNETGVIFPVEKMAELVKQRSSAIFHVDGVNAAGKIPIDLKGTKIDLYSISGHKFHGPKGVGALYVRNGVVLPPNSVGGGQEGGRRAGTEAVHQIAGLGEAAKFVSDLSEMENVRALRNRLESEILDNIPNSVLIGDSENRLPNTSNISFENTNGEVLLARLNDLGICVSTGSACNEETKKVSPVLKAMGVPFSQAMGAIRFSLGRSNTVKEIDFVLEHLPKIINELQGIAVAE